MKKKRPKLKESIPLGEIIPQVLQSYPHGSNQGLSRVWALWDQTVGEALAQNARPAAFKDNLLLVHVASPTWIHHLQFLKADLITKLNNALQNEMVADIKFKVGPL